MTGKIPTDQKIARKTHAQIRCEVQEKYPNEDENTIEYLTILAEIQDEYKFNPLPRSYTKKTKNGIEVIAYTDDQRGLD